MVTFNCVKNLCKVLTVCGWFGVVEGSFGWLWVVLDGFAWFWLIVCFTKNTSFHVFQLSSFLTVSIFNSETALDAQTMSDFIFRVYE